jgi:hypothetical protein
MSQAGRQGGPGAGGGGGKGAGRGCGGGPYGQKSASFGQQLDSFRKQLQAVKKKQDAQMKEQSIRVMSLAMNGQRVRMNRLKHTDWAKCQAEAKKLILRWIDEKQLTEMTQQERTAEGVEEKQQRLRNAIQSIDHQLYRHLKFKNREMIIRFMIIEDTARMMQRVLTDDATKYYVSEDRQEGLRIKLDGTISPPKWQRGAVEEAVEEAQ